MARVTRSVSIDGASFDLDRGEWDARRLQPSGDSHASGVREGLVSVDGGWFDLDRGGWDAGPRPRTRASIAVVPEGFVSIDGALFPLEPS